MKSLKSLAMLVSVLALWGGGAADAAEKKPVTPTLFLIGDSTVKNGSGTGAGGLWGWGQVVGEHFDKTRLRIENRALGGRSSRTFLTEGLWEKVLKDIQPGDFVLMQFGHNDGGELAKGDRPRASLKGDGEETRDVVVEKTGKSETVHSYGWYLRKYISEAKERGAKPVVLSPVPRNIWKDARVSRASKDYGKWAAAAAQQAGAAFIDLNEIIAMRYEKTGEEIVKRDYFTEKDHTHTTQAGSRVNAECVAEGVRELKEFALHGFLKDGAASKTQP